MPTVSRTFSVTPSPQVVIDYLKDFANAEQWDPGTETCVQIGSGPVEVGTSWNNTSKILGLETELVYTLEKLTDDTVELVGRNKTATSTDTITVTPTDGGSQIVYLSEIVFHGAAKLAEPAAKLVFEKLGNDTEKQMTEVLNTLA